MRQAHRNLIQDTKLYLEQNYPTGGKIVTTPEIASFFASQGKEPKQIQAPPPSKEIAPKPPQKQIGPSLPVKEITPPKPIKELPSKEQPKQLPPPRKEDYADIKSFYKNTYPNIKLQENLPEVLLVYQGLGAEEVAFLQKIGDAITKHFVLAEAISHEEIVNHKASRLLIRAGLPTSLETPPCHTLIMEEPSSYMHDQKKKGELWKQISELLKS